MVVSSPPTVLDFYGGCAVPCLLSLALGWVRFWPAVSTAPVRCEVCSPGCPSWLVLVSCLLSFTCSCGGMVWSPVCGPSCYSCVLGSCGVSVAPFYRLGLWSHPLLLLFLAGFLPLVFVRTWVGRLQSCLLLGGNSPSLVLVVFAWRFLQCGCPGSLSFSWTLFLGFFPLASSFCW